MPCALPDVELLRSGGGRQASPISDVGSWAHSQLWVLLEELGRVVAVVPGVLNACYRGSLSPFLLSSLPLSLNGLRDMTGVLGFSLTPIPWC